MFAILLLFLTETLFATMDVSRFRDGSVHLKYLGVKGLRVAPILEAFFKSFPGVRKINSVLVTPLNTVRLSR